jgi:hypothetical protein
MRFKVSTEGTNRQGLAEPCRRFANEEWLPNLVTGAVLFAAFGVFVAGCGPTQADVAEKELEQYKREQEIESREEEIRFLRRILPYEYEQLEYKMREYHDPSSQGSTARTILKYEHRLAHLTGENPTERLQRASEKIDELIEAQRKRDAEAVRRGERYYSHPKPKRDTAPPTHDQSP